MNTINFTLASLTLAASSSLAVIDAKARDLFPNISPARIQYISPEKAIKNNVGHMVMKIR